MNSDPPRLLEQLDPPRRSGGFWIAGSGVLVALVVAMFLLRSGRPEPIQETTLASAVVPAKTATAPAETAVAAPSDTPPPAATMPHRSARHATAKPTATAAATAKPTATAKPEPKDEPLPEFPVPPEH